jgi:glycosyltransferase involved in cell wall biosynthesis
MSKIIYLTEWVFKSSDGITKKIKNQVKAMAEYNDVTLFVINSNEMSINQGPETRKNKVFSYYHLWQYATKNNVDVLYVRNVGGLGSVLFLTLSLLLRKKRIIIEIPTYPFDGETDRVGIKQILSKTVRSFYKFSVTSIVYMGAKTNIIWNIPAIQIENGIEVSDYPLKKQKKISEAIEFICVSSLARWHGYDRLIKAINEANIPCVFHVVGDGPELKNLQQLAKNEDSLGTIIFHGFKEGDDLDAIFDMAHIAIDSLGRHRTGNAYNSSLKSKEYSARGIPFIKSHIDNAFDDCEFVYDVTADESIIDINEVVKWYKKINEKPEVIREFAKENLCWEKQIEKIGL